MPEKLVIDNKIDPEAWYSDSDVFLRLDIQTAVQAQARKAGQLRFIQRGTTFLYKGQWVLDWLESGGQQEPAQQIRAKARASQARDLSQPSLANASTTRAPTISPAASFSTPERTTPMNDHQVIDAWNAAVQAKVAEGLNKQDAVRIVVKERPELHRAYLIACNRNRPNAIRHLRA